MPNIRHGFDSFAGVGKETTWGTAVARTQFFEIAGESGGFDPGRTEVQSWRNRFVSSHFDAGKKAAKTLTIPFTFEALEEIMRAAFWGYAGAADTPVVGVNRHTYTIGTAKPSPLTVEVGNSDPGASEGAYIYPGCYVRRITVNLRAGETGTIEVEFAGKDETEDDESASPTFPDLDTILVTPDQVVVKFDSGSAETEIEEATIVLEPGLDEGRLGLGTAYAREPQLSGRATATVNVSRDWYAKDEYTKFLSGAAAQIEVICTGPIITGATPYLAHFTIPNVVYMGESPVHSGPGIVGETISAKAQHDATDTAVKLVLENTTTVLS